MRINANSIRNVFFVVAVITAFSLPWVVLTGFLLWLSPFMFLNSVLALKSAVLLNLLGLLGLVLIILKNKWICKYACPLGVVCDLASKSRPQQSGYRNLRNFNKYLAVFAITIAITGLPVLIVSDPFNLFHLSLEFFRTGMHAASLVKFSILLTIIILNLWLPNIWCSRICPLGGLQQWIIDIKRYFRKPRMGIKRIATVNRRVFIAGLSGLASGFLISRFVPVSVPVPIRPPASLPEHKFNMVCARCGNCSSACPTSIIRQSLEIRNPEMLLTPVIDMSDSYCLPECTSCGDVCPSGAITKFSEADKKSLFMAKVMIDTDNCILQQQRECDLCKYHCAYEAITIEKSGQNQIALPAVLQSNCVGCGACKIVCPASVIKIVAYNLKNQSI